MDDNALECPYCGQEQYTHEPDDITSYFPNIDNMPEWELTRASDIKEYNGVKYQFCVYDRCDYEIFDMITHEEDKSVEENDMIVIVKTFNDYKNIIIRLEADNKFAAYSDNWEYLYEKENLLKFADKVKECIKKNKEEKVTKKKK